MTKLARGLKKEIILSVGVGLLMLSFAILGNEFLGLAILLFGMALWTGGIIAWKRVNLRVLWTDSGMYLLGICVMLLLALLISNRIFAGKWKLLRLAAYLVWGYILLRGFVVGVVRKRNRWCAWKLNVLTVTFGLACLFMVLEGVYLFRHRSHGSYPASFGNINWYRTNWQPVNSLGYRGEEPVKGKRKILVLGDSFAGGWGIDDYRDRFPELLGKSLQDSLQVLNLGMPGSNTRGQYRRLQEYGNQNEGEQPELLILAYVLNDVQEAADDFGKEYKWKDPMLQYPFFMRPLMHYSTFFNFLLAERGYGIEQESYSEYIRSCYADSRIWGRHVKDLEKIMDWAEERAVPVIGLFFPLMQDLRGSDFLTQRLSDHFMKRMKASVNLVSPLQYISTDSLGVHPLDPHPSRQVHQITAEILKGYF